MRDGLGGTTRFGRPRDRPPISERLINATHRHRTVASPIPGCAIPAVAAAGTRSATVVRLTLAHEVRGSFVTQIVSHALVAALRIDDLFSLDDLSRRKSEHAHNGQMPTSRFCKPLADCVPYQIAPRSDPQLSHHSVLMPVDRLHATRQLPGDLPAGEALADEPQHLEFAAGETLQARHGGGILEERLACRHWL